MTWAPSRADGGFDAVFHPRPLTAPALDPLAASPAPLTKVRPWREYANEPLRGRTVRELVPKLRQHMASRLPDYMVPSAFVVLDAFPVTPNGKIDRRALPAPDSLRTELASSFVVPRGTVEESLAEIWARVLNVERVGALDNFFELGGDSILCIHVVAAARAAGVHFAAKDLFQNPTVSGLGKVARAASTVSAEQGPVKGAIPLTPIQHWFFEQDLAEPHHFNQSLLFELGWTLDAGRVETALRDVVNHHDALRSRFRRVKGTWTQDVGPLVDRVRLETHDLTDVALPDRGRRLEAAAARLQGSLDLASGTLLTAALFRERGADMSRHCLLLVVHHLAIDAVSWAPLLQDLQSGLEKRPTSAERTLPPKTSSYQAWSRALTAYAQTSAVKEQSGLWLRLPWSETRPIPLDHPSGVNTVASAASVDCSLSEVQTHALTHDIPSAAGGDVNSILLATLARALAPWTRQEHIAVDLEGHGREEVLEGIDVSRTVGWFTAIFPVLLHVKPGEDAASTLRRVHADLAAYPSHGLTFGLARYLSSDSQLTTRLRDLPRPQVAFNYLGQLDTALGTGALRLLRQAQIGPSRGPRNRRLHAIEVNTGILEGKFQMNWTYSTELHDKPTIERLAQAYAEELTALLASREGVPLTRAAESAASSFGWSADDIDDLLRDIDKRR